VSGSGRDFWPHSGQVNFVLLAFFAETGKARPLSFAQAVA